MLILKFFILQVSCYEPRIELDTGAIVGTFVDEMDLEAVKILEMQIFENRTTKDNSVNLSIERFYGVPYAKPPTETRRWKPPVNIGIGINCVIKIIKEIYFQFYK